MSDRLKEIKEKFKPGSAIIVSHETIKELYDDIVWLISQLERTCEGCEYWDAITKWSGGCNCPKTFFKEVVYQGDTFSCKYYEPKETK